MLLAGKDRSGHLYVSSSPHIIPAQAGSIAPLMLMALSIVLVTPGPLPNNKCIFFKAKEWLLYPKQIVSEITNYEEKG